MADLRVFGGGDEVRHHGEFATPSKRVPVQLGDSDLRHGPQAHLHSVIYCMEVQPPPSADSN